MIEAQVTDQNLQVTDGFPVEAQNNRPANSNVVEGIYLAPIKKLPKVYKSPNINAYYVLMAEFKKNPDGTFEAVMEADAAGVQHQAVRQVYPSLFSGEIATITVSATDPEIQTGVGPRMRPRGTASQKFAAYSNRNAGMEALYSETHKDANDPDSITDLIFLASAESIWTINRNRTGAGANPSRHVQRKVYTSDFVHLPAPLKYLA